MGNPEADPGIQLTVLMGATPNSQPFFQLHACLRLLTLSFLLEWVL